MLRADKLTTFMWLITEINILRCVVSKTSKDVFSFRSIVVTTPGKSKIMSLSDKVLGEAASNSKMKQTLFRIFSKGYLAQP